MMTKYEKIGDKETHYCPRCNIETKNCMRLAVTDVKKRDIGKKYGYWYYGQQIKCTKCGWVGTWYIPKNDLKKLESEYQKYMRSRKSNIKRSDI